MFARRSAWLFFFLSVLANLALAAPVVIGVRGNEVSTEAYSKAKGLTQIKTDTKEFANGNTFVRLMQSIVNRDVTIILPEKLTPDTLMEVLIKIRTARTNGASQIQLVSPEGKVSALSGLKGKIDLRKLFDVAGADRVVGWQKSEPIVSTPSQPPAVLSTNKKAAVLDLFHSDLAQELSKSLGIPMIKEGEAPRNLNGLTVFLVAPPVMPVNQSFFEVVSAIETLASHSAKVVLITPYLPYARSDKKDQPGVTITGRLVADLLERVGMSSIVFVRAHAPQSEGFFSVPTFHINGRTTINAFLRGRKIDRVISPDAGFQKDATLYANELGVDVVVLNKQRDPATGVATLMEMGATDFTGMTVAIIDDETASGGTLDKAARFMKKRGAKKVIAVVTHLTGDASQALNSEAIDELVVTNTLPVNLSSPKLRVLSIGAEIASAVREITDSMVIDCRNEMKNEERSR